jgi:hypothetical protein
MKLQTLIIEDSGCFGLDDTNILNKILVSMRRSFINLSIGVYSFLALASFKIGHVPNSAC